MMAETPDPQEAARSTALDHAWSWFSLHATQRLQAVNFFLVATAFLTAAFVTAAKEKLFALAAAVAILAICISMYFYRMERRVRSLIHASENAIGPLQAALSKQLGVEPLCIVSHVEDARAGEWKYSKVFRHLYFTTGITFVLGLLYSAWAAYNAPGAATTTASAEPLKIVLRGILGAFLVFVGYEMIVGVPRRVESDSGVNVTRDWALLLLGIAGVVAGVVVILHLTFTIL